MKRQANITNYCPKCAAVQDSAHTPERCAERVKENDCQFIMRKYGVGRMMAEAMAKADNTHTPGPWSRNIKPASKYPVVFAGRNTHVATLSTNGLTDSEIEGNCNLIASAPDLLKALKAFDPGELFHTTHPPASTCAICAARRAIAKAEGLN